MIIINKIRINKGRDKMSRDEMKKRSIFSVEGGKIVFKSQVFEQNDWHTKKIPNQSARGDYNQFIKSINLINSKEIDHVTFGNITINQIDKEVISVRQKNRYFLFADYKIYMNSPIFKDVMAKISSQYYRQQSEHIKRKKLKLVRKKIANRVASVAAIAFFTAVSIHLLSDNKVFGMFNETDKESGISSSSSQIEILDEIDEPLETYEDPMLEYGVLEETDDQLVEESSLPAQQTEEQEKSLSIEEKPSQIVEEDSVDFITQIGKMFHMTKSQALTAIESNPQIVESESNPDLGIIRAIAYDYWYKKDILGIDSTPTIENISRQEREQIIVDMAVLHGMDDQETLATILAIHRLETGHGTSNLCVNQNNQGGIIDDGEFLSYPTVAAGAESFVRTVKNQRNSLIGEGIYNYNNTLAENIKDYYCTEEVSGAGPWDDAVDEIKKSILENNELSNYNMDFGSNSK